MSVNAVRKQSTDEEVQTIAKSLIKSWKKLVGKEMFNFFSLVSAQANGHYPPSLTLFSAFHSMLAV